MHNSTVVQKPPSDSQVNTSPLTNNIMDHPNPRRSTLEMQQRISKPRARSHPSSKRATLNKGVPPRTHQLNNRNDEGDNESMLEKIVHIGTDSGTQVKVHLHQSKSETDLVSVVKGPSGSISSPPTHHGEEDRSGRDFNHVTHISRHELYKEAFYTAVHMLGKPSRHFPTSKEQLCLYVHETFSESSSVIIML